MSLPLEESISVGKEDFLIMRHKHRLVTVSPTFERNILIFPACLYYFFLSFKKTLNIFRNILWNIPDANFRGKAPMCNWTQHATICLPFIYHIQIYSRSSPEWYIILFCRWKLPYSDGYICSARMFWAPSLMGQSSAPSPFFQHLFNY